MGHCLEIRGVPNACFPKHCYSSDMCNRVPPFRLILIVTSRSTHNHTHATATTQEKKTRTAVDVERQMPGSISSQKGDAQRPVETALDSQMKSGPVQTLNKRRVPRVRSPKDHSRPLKTPGARLTSQILSLGGLHSLHKLLPFPIFPEKMWEEELSRRS